MIIEGLEQGGKEWLQTRIGIVTASRVADVLSELKRGGETAARRNYKLALVIESLTGLTEETYVTQAMQFGIDNEQYARAEYELSTGLDVEQIGFAFHPRIPRFGASPDGLVGDGGLLEIKVPTSATHVEWMLNGCVPDEYRPQMFAQMACTERDWCDFCSFDPRLPSGLRLFIRRLARDEKAIQEMEAKVEKFIQEVEQMLEQLKAGGSLVPALVKSLESVGG